MYIVYRISYIVYRISYIVYQISTSIKYSSSKYIKADIFIKEKIDKSKKSIIVKISRKIYFIKGLDTKILIRIDILSFKNIIVDLLV